MVCFVDWRSAKSRFWSLKSSTRAASLTVKVHSYCNLLIWSQSYNLFFIRFQALQRWQIDFSQKALLDSVIVDCIMWISCDMIQKKKKAALEISTAITLSRKIYYKWRSVLEKDYRSLAHILLCLGKKCRSSVCRVFFSAKKTKKTSI